MDWPYKLSPTEQKLGPMGILKKIIIYTLPQEISNPVSWYKTSLLKLDNHPLANIYVRSTMEGAMRSGAGAAKKIHETG